MGYRALRSLSPHRVPVVFSFAMTASIRTGRAVLTLFFGLFFRPSVYASVVVISPVLVSCEPFRQLAYRPRHLERVSFK